jgi:hypothetical protein
LLPDISGLTFTINKEQNRTTPGRIDVLSAGVEGDPYLAANRLPDEGESAAE